MTFPYPIANAALPTQRGPASREAHASFHRSAEKAFAAAHRWTMFGVVIFGATLTWAPCVCAIAVTALGAADLAFDFVGRAQAHADAARRCFDEH